MEVSTDPARGRFNSGTTERHHAMRTPRQLLALLSIALGVIAVQTFLYRPEFLAFSPVWSSTTLLAGISCAAAAVRPRRLYVAVSGAAVVTSSCARGLALVVELSRDGHDGPGAPLIVAACTWGIVALLGFVVWREYVLPWSIAHEAERRPPWSVQNEGDLGQ